MITSRIDRVTVYARGARITRAAETTINSGTTQLVFTELPANIDQESVRFRGTGEFTVLSVSTRTVFHGPETPTTDPPEIAAIRQRLDELRIALAVEQARLESTGTEERYVASISESDTKEPRSVIDMVAAADFLRERLPDIKQRRIEIQEQIKTLTEEQNQLQEQLREYNATFERKRSTEVVVTVDAHRSTEGTFEIDYQVDSARWVTRYDLRVADLSSPMELTHFADIEQGSGEAWNNAVVTLSTGNPESSAYLPQLPPWRLGPPRNEVFYERREMDEVVVTGAKAPSGAAKDLLGGAAGPQVESVSYPTVTEYVIAEKLTVLADGKPRTVELRKVEMPGTFEHVVVPKRNPVAFLTASVPDWSTYDLEPGNASIFMGKVFVGNAFLTTEATTDTLVVPLGPDRGITVRREKMREFTKVRFLGSRRQSSLGVRISVRNNKDEAATIIIRDQVPVSTDDDIDVDIGSISGASHEEETGLLEWVVEVQPGSTETRQFDYTVKYPKSWNMPLE